MIYHLFQKFVEQFPLVNVTRYITFRSGCAFITSFLLVMLFWKFSINKLKRLKMIERIDMYGHVHLESLFAGKKGTPTMGGVLLLFSVVLSVLLWARWDNYFVWLSVGMIILLGLVGLWDDLSKIKTGAGFSRKKKLFFQIIIGMILGIAMVLGKNVSTTWDFPFFKRVSIDLGYFYIFWAALIIVATSNAVNFTDGLDGLAIGVLITNFLLFAFLSYLVGHMRFAQYLFVPHVRGAGELTVLCLSLTGAGLAFLWFNAYPAEIFMGNVGSLALGGIIGAIALFIKKEFLLVVSGGLLVMEALSVILQIASVKITGKRIFKAAPFHHHFQLLGWQEPKIIVRFWIISILCAMISLLTLKLR